MVRRTQLKAKTELRRGECTLRRTEIRPVSRKQAAMQRVRVVSERDLGRDENSNGVCARCGRFGEVHGHELRNRSHGGDPADPDCLLCNRCNSDIENDSAPGNRERVCWAGWKIDPRYPHDPVLQVGQAWALDGSLVIFGTVPQYVEMP